MVMILSLQVSANNSRQPQTRRTGMLGETKVFSGLFCKFSKR